MNIGVVEDSTSCSSVTGSDTGDICIVTLAAVSGMQLSDKLIFSLLANSNPPSITFDLTF